MLAFLTLVAISKWSDIPLDILRSEVARRQVVEDAPRPICGSNKTPTYNTTIHVLALFLILFLSIAACAFPIVVRRFPKFPVPHRFLFVSRHFGTGVLIATAFVHLFPTAYISLTDPCLPPFWNKTYPAMPGFIAMTSVFIVVGIEMFFATRGAGHVHGSEYDQFVFEDSEQPDAHLHGGENGHTKAPGRRSESFRHFRDGSGRPPEIALVDLPSSSDNLMAGRSPSSGSPPPGQSFTPVFDASTPRPTNEDEDDYGDNDSHLSLNLSELEPSRSPAPPEDDTSGLLNGAQAAQHPRRLPSRASSGGPPYDSAAHQRALLQCLLLEAGILFHSVFIGMALSVTSGPAFLVLLVAISFHQTFEGLALGSRIAGLRFPPRSAKPWLMTLAYGTTTPLGQAIGLAVHRLYDPASQTGLLMVGIMNAISTGLLVFAGLVELLAEDFLSVESYKVLSGRRRIEACIAVVAGSMLMALVGAFA